MIMRLIQYYHTYTEVLEYLLLAKTTYSAINQPYSDGVFFVPVLQDGKFILMYKVVITLRETNRL